MTDPNTAPSINDRITELADRIKARGDYIQYQTVTDPLRQLAAAQQEINQVKAGLEKTGKSYYLAGGGFSLKGVRMENGDLFTFGTAPAGSVLEMGAEDGLSTFIVTGIKNDVAGNTLKLLPCFSRVHFTPKTATGPRRPLNPYSATPASIETSKKKGELKCCIPATSRPANDDVVLYDGRRYQIDGLYPSPPGTVTLSLVPYQEEKP